MASRQKQLIIPKGKKLGPTTEALIAEVLKRNEEARKVKIPERGPFRSTRPSHPGKPHGPAETIRRRCVFCGYIVNDSERFTWAQKRQTFKVKFGGRKPGGQGIIIYTQVKDPEYDNIMMSQLRRVAEAYGFQLVPSTGAPRRTGT